MINAGYAFVILRVDDKQDAHLKTLAEVKDQIDPLIKQQKAQQAADSAASALLSQARTGGLDKAAAAKGMQVVATDFVSRTDSLPGIGSFAAVHGGGIQRSRKISARSGAGAAGLCNL